MEGLGFGLKGYWGWRIGLMSAVGRWAWGGGGRGGGWGV